MRKHTYTFCDVKAVGANHDQTFSHMLMWGLVFAKPCTRGTNARESRHAHTLTHMQILVLQQVVQVRQHSLPARNGQWINKLSSKCSKPNLRDARVGNREPVTNIIVKYDSQMMMMFWSVKCYYMTTAPRQKTLCLTDIYKLFSWIKLIDLKWLTHWLHQSSSWKKQQTSRNGKSLFLDLSDFK